MPEYIDAEVDALRSSRSTDHMTLLLGVEGDRETLVEQVEQTDAHVDAELGRATLRVTAPELAIDTLCGLDGVTSIEVDREDVRVLAPGNGDSRRRLTR